MSRAGPLVAATVLMTISMGPVVAADPTGQEVPISVQNTTAPVVEPDAHPDHLASTGADVFSMVRTGIALLAAGALAVAFTRRTGGAA